MASGITRVDGVADEIRLVWKEIRQTILPRFTIFNTHSGQFTSSVGSRRIGHDGYNAAWLTQATCQMADHYDRIDIGYRVIGREERGVRLDYMRQ